MSPVRSPICCGRRTHLAKTGRLGSPVVVGRPERPSDQWLKGSRYTSHGNLALVVVEDLRASFALDPCGLSST